VGDGPALDAGLSEGEIEQVLGQDVDRHGAVEPFRGHLLLAGVLAQRLAESTETVPARDTEHVEPLDLVKVVLTGCAGKHTLTAEDVLPADPTRRARADHLTARCD
jgi:hypothetical protein